jgi:flagellar hook-associated protein 3 FlgL
MMADQFLVDANKSLNRVATAQQQVDSTKRISSIDDDPLATMSSLKARNKLSSLSVYQSSITTAKSSLKECENGVSSLNDVVQSAYQLIVQANSGEKTDSKTPGQKKSSDLADIANQIAGLRDEVVSIGNSTLGTEYLFNGNSSKAPFSVDGTGHLTYNGIDLTAYALKDEVADDISGIGKAGTSITGTETTLAASDTSDYSAKNSICPKILDQLDSMITNGNTVLQSAKEAGIGTSDLESLKSSISDLTTLRDAITTESSKPLQQDLIDAGTVDAGDTATLENLGFQKSDVLNLLNGGGSNDFTHIYSSFSSELSTVQTNVNAQITAGTDKKLGEESLASTKLQVGSTQTIETTVNGLKLMGVDVSVTKDADGNVTDAATESSNTTNLYYLLDKCVNILNGNLDSSLLGEMSSTLLSAQSNVLSLDTKVGTSQNRLSMLSDRYTASNLTYKGMKSDAEDADMASAIVNLTSAKTVYDAALAAGAKIVQTSLVDFLS